MAIEIFIPNNNHVLVQTYCLNYYYYGLKNKINCALQVVFCINVSCMHSVKNFCIRDVLYPTNMQDLINNRNYKLNMKHPLIPFLKLPEPLPTTIPHMLLIGRRYLATNNRILEFRGKLLTNDYKSNLVFKQ